MKRINEAVRKPFIVVLCLLLGSLSAMSFVIDGEGYMGMSDPPASSSSYLWCALAVCFALLYWYLYEKKKQRPSPVMAALGLLFGVVNVLGGMLFAYDSWAMLSDGKTAVLTLLRCVGQALPMTAFFTWLHDSLSRGILSRRAALDDMRLSRFPRLLGWYRKHRTLGCMALLLLCWSPYLISYYPGTVCWDLGEMAAQFFGMREMDTWHPVFLTWIFGGLIWLGRLVGSDNLGAALFTLLQALMLSYALSRSLAFLRMLGLNRAVRLCTLCFFALTPFFGGYAQFISKDTLYVSTLLLFSLNAAQTLLDHAGELREQRRKRLFALFLWGLLTSLLRSNGLYVILPTSVLLVAFGARGKERLSLAAALAACVCGALLFSGVLVPALGIKDETASGLYSVCFQQSARVLRDHPEAVTQAEYEEINRVLDGENLAQLYEPWISDPVKYTFKFYGQGAEAEKAALQRYLTTWRSMLTKYPLTYAESFFAGNISYYAFTPKLEGQTYNNQAGNRLVFETYDVGQAPEYLHTTQLSALDGLRSLLAVFARGWRHIPLLSLLYGCATYTWLLVGAGLSAAKQKKWRRLAAFFPALLSLGVCMLSPVNDYFRYFLPIVAMTPSLLGLCDQGAKD
ncbi:MAG: DUF6020 family protein [Eubacteriales bacterium]|nr:DUF6020 family protein [Eubacteriales bacterium]